jgi:hypothetical protein
MIRRVYAVNRTLVQTMLTVMIGMLIMTTLSIWYTNYVDERSNHAWCEIINSLHQRNAAIPKPDKDTLLFREQLTRLKNQYEC